MLFVFRTRDPSKDLLRIVSQSDGRNILQEMLNLPYLEEAIRKRRELLEGSLHYMCTIDNIVVLSWNFKYFTPSRKATRENFGNVLLPERLFEFKSKCPRGTVSMPYFVIQNKDSDIFDDPDDPKQWSIRDEYLYPDVPEGSRIEALRESLKSNQYNVKKVDSVKTVVSSRGLEICILMNIIYHPSSLLYQLRVHQKIKTRKLLAMHQKDVRIPYYDLVLNCYGNSINVASTHIHVTSYLSKGAGM